MVRYELITRASDEEDLQEICRWLEDVAKKGQKLPVMNFYMEMPIVSHCLITVCDQNSFSVFPSENQVKVLLEKQKTIIRKNDDLCVLANCQAINSRSGEVVLSGFRYIQLHAEQRETFRVRLIKPINVSLETEKGRMAGVLKDLSIGGCRVSVFIRGLQPGSKITLSLKMFDAATQSILNISVIAQLVRVDGEKMPINLGLKFEHNTETEEKVTHFINQRQMEMIKSLKESLT